MTQLNRKTLQPAMRFNSSDNADQDNGNSKQSADCDQEIHDSEIDKGAALTEDLISCASSSMMLDTNDYGNHSTFSFGDLDLDTHVDKTRETYVGTTTTTMPTSIQTPNTISLPKLSAQNSDAARKASSSIIANRRKREKSSNVINGDASLTTINEDIDAITEQMGKLWFPSSVQDLTDQFVRDKNGRLVPPSEDRTSSRSPSLTDGSSSCSSYSEVSAKSSYNEWYDEAIFSVHAATTNLVGNLTSTEAYEKQDPKLQTSMALAKNIDKVWAKELYEMDAGERENIINEIHGIKSNRAIEETQDSIDEEIVSFRSFLETNLEEELDNRESIVPPVTKAPYRRGVYELRSDYITSKPFLIKFLRICHHNFEDAALRYFRYLDLLHLLFGDDSLTRPVELTDLTKREIRYLRKGQMQLLPSRDRAGRRIFAFSGCDDLDFNIREKYRVNIYLVDVLSDDIITQKLGAVSLNAPRVRYDIVDNPFGFEGMTLRMGKQELLGGKCTEAQFFRKINEAVPIRFSAIHYFAPRTIIYEVGRAIILSLLGKEHRKIVRFHAGSQLECNYSLRSFGIPPEDITITEGNNIKTKNVLKFINARRSIEPFRQRQRERRAHMQEQHKQRASSSTKTILKDEEECPGIECPGVDCIVFGDKGMNSLPANVEFREMVRLMERQREESINSTDGKILPIKEFIESIIEKARSPEHKLRFLVYDKEKCLFVDIRDHNTLCKRVSQALRDQRKRAKLLASQGQGSVQTTPRGGSKHMRTMIQGMEASSPSGGDVLDVFGSSIMGLGAGKRLKRSYDRGNNVACFSFCTNTVANVSEQNNGSSFR